MIRRPRRALAIGVAPLLGAIGLLTPTVAGATEIATNAGALEVTAGPNEINRIAIERKGGFFRIVDSTATVTTSDPDCSVNGGHLGRCARAGIGAMVVNTRDLDDEVSVAAPTSATLNGGAGTDLLRGGSGDDVIRVGERGLGFNSEQAFGGPGSDLLRGSTSPNGNTFLDGGEGDDTLIGGPGTEFLEGGPNADVLRGGEGDFDRATYSTNPGPVTVTINNVANDGSPGEGDDVRTDVEGVSGTSAGDTLTGSSADDSLVGFDGDDVLRGAGGNDAIDGGAGEDELNGGADDDDLANGFGDAEADVFIGGAGVDLVRYTSKSNPITVTINNVANDGEAGEGDDVRTSVENATGGSGNDTITGSPAANRLLGWTGDDELRGGAGDDDLRGDIDFDNASFVGDDTLLGGPGDDLLAGGFGGDDLAGAQGQDTGDFSQRDDPLDVTLDGAANDGEAGEGDNVRGNVEVVLGGGGDDEISGNDADNLFFGGAGDDTLRGLAGNDLFDGETPGFFNPAFGADTFIGGAGKDGVSYASHFSSVTADPDDVADDGESGEGDNVRASVEDLFGGFGSDTLTGSAAANVLEGSIANSFDNDVLNGLGGPDFLAAGRGVDTFNGDGGNDRIHSRGDGIADTDNCDGGTDTVWADSIDVLSNCENVFNPAAASSPGALERRWDESRRRLRRAAAAVERIPSQPEARGLGSPPGD